MMKFLNNMKVPSFSKVSWRRFSGATEENFKVKNVKTSSSYRRTMKQLNNMFSCQLVTVDNQHDMVKKAVSILHEHPYDQQLSLKEKKHQEVLQRLHRNKSLKGQMYKTHKIIGSPEQEQYRNKSSFSVGHDIQGRITVGYHVGGSREGWVTVSPEHVTIIRDDHKMVAGVYQQFLLSLPVTRLALFKDGDWSGGHWGALMVRSNNRDELMVRIEYYTNNEENYSESEVEMCLQKLLSSHLNVKSVYITLNNADGSRHHQLLHGDDVLIEQIGDLSLCLGPDTFCQVNPAVAVHLLDFVSKTIRSGEQRTLLDLCCGAGMFSLKLSSQFRGTIGIDWENTEYAARNMEINNVGNCRFETRRVENVLPTVAHRLTESGAAASGVLNPGRTGVHQNVITAIRRMPVLDNLVYISCKPEDDRVLKNLTYLMKSDSKKCPSSLRTVPFKLTESVALDMFPQTHHCEHVFVFKR